MKASSVLSLRHLASKIHPPLPLSPKDSQKLLSLLNASFREHLDQEHGKGSRSNTLATDKHFHSILANPLFILPRQQPHQQDGREYHKQTDGLASASQAIDNLMMKPMEYFSNHVAAGTASLEVAKKCLAILKRSVVASKMNTTEVSPQVSSPILNWLWSSGMANSMEFLHDRSFISLLIPFLIAEGQVRHAWKWFSRLYSEVENHKFSLNRGYLFEDVIRMQACLLKILLDSEIRYGTGLDGALKAFVEVVEQAKCWDVQAKRNARRILHSAGSLLVHRIMDLESTTGLEHRLFDKLLHITNLWSRCSSRDAARLSLVHPVSPDPYPALKYVRTSMLDLTQAYTIYHNQKAIFLYLKTAEVLLCQNKQADAEWLLQFVQERLPDGIGVAGQQKTHMMQNKKEQISDTEMSLRQLDVLAFG